MIVEKSIIKTPDAFKSWIYGVDLNKVISLDLETDGLGFGCQIEGVSLCDGLRACYYPIEVLDRVEALKDLQTLLTGIKGLIVHNAYFDIRVLREHGLKVDCPIYDSMIAAHLLNENQSCALKKLAVRVLKVPQSEILTFKEASKDGLNTVKFYNYATNDAIWTYQMWEVSAPLIEKQGLHDLFYNIEIPCIDVLIDMYIKGVNIDITKLKDFQEHLLAEKDKLETLVINSAGLKVVYEKDLFGFEEKILPINLNSSPQIAKIIQGKFKIKLPKTEPSKTCPEGQPSTSVEVLAKFREKCSFIDALLQYRKIDKLLNTFIEPMFGHLYPDGKIRTNFNSSVAVTGRLSSSKPDLQNIPKKVTKDAIVNVRELFIPDDGCCFIVADYDSQELRQLANVTKDPILIDAFNNNKDLHLTTANGCLNLGIEKEQLCKSHPDYNDIKNKFEHERHIGKNGINFPIIYGSTAVGVSKSNGVTQKVAQGWIDNFFKFYPAVSESIKETNKEIFRNHYIVDDWGRRRRFIEINNRAKRQAFNWKIQGYCASLLKVVLHKLYKLLNDKPEWGARLCLTIHDDVLISCKRAFAEVAMSKIKYIMENSVDVPVQFLVDINIQQSYAG